MCSVYPMVNKFILAHKKSQVNSNNQISMAETVTIPLIGYEISINSLVAIVLLLCIFFTFFSVSISLVGFDPIKESDKSSCSHDDDYYQHAEVKLLKSTKDRLQHLHSKLSSELSSELSSVL